MPESRHITIDTESIYLCMHVVEDLENEKVLIAVGNQSLKYCNVMTFGSRDYPNIYKVLSELPEAMLKDEELQRRRMSAYPAQRC